MSRKRGSKSARYAGWGVAGCLLALVALCMAVFVVQQVGSRQPAPDAALAKDDRGRTVLTVAYSPEKAELFERLAAEFNKASKQYTVRPAKVEMVDMLSQAADGKFTAISPDSAVWLGPLDQTWQAQDPNRAPLVGSLSRYALSPVVIAMWQSEAQKMGYPGKPVGWSDIVARATAEQGFRWSHPSTTTAAGLLTTTAEFYAASGKTSQLTKQDLRDAKVQDYVRKVERTIQQYGGESEEQVLARLLAERTRSLDALVAQEAFVVRFNQATKGEKLTAVYPREGTLWMDHPLALMDGPWIKAEHRRGFQELTNFFRSAAMQRIVMQQGYRPADLGISLDAPESQIQAANGVDPTQPQTMLQIPPYGVLDDIRSVWALLKRPANIYLVADVSGSMEGDKLNRAKDALLSFTEQVKGDQDRIGLSVFSTNVREVVPLGPISTNRQAMTTVVKGLKSESTTALYDAILMASERLHEERQPDRINAVVVMTDGIENASKRVRSSSDPQPLIVALQDLDRKYGSPVLVFTVAYGSDADFAELQKISAATRAQAYQGTPDTIRRLYELLSAFFS